MQKVKRRWEDNIKIGLGEIEWEGVVRIDLALDRQVAGCFVRGDELTSDIKCGEFLLTR
jgi:hypothetical protein